MRSHFIPQKLTAVCAVAGATTLLGGAASAQNFVAADYATNSTYTAGWAAGQNGGHGFGPWSFDGTTAATNGAPDPGAQQSMSGSSALGTAWTLFDSAAKPPPAGPGMSEAGRAITEPGGLQTGQTFETVVQNPTAYHFFRGFDILLCNATDNDIAGDGSAAFRLTVFGYYGGVGNTYWTVTDGNPYGSPVTSLEYTNTAAAGLKIDLTLTSPSNYSLTMTPLNGTGSYNLTDRLALVSTNMNTGLGVTELPINFVTYRLWLGPSSGTNDTADNFEISSMTIEGLPLNIQVAGTNAILSWLDISNYYLESATTLGPPANWTSNTIAPTVINGESFVTNRVAGQQQFFRLQLQQ